MSSVVSTAQRQALALGRAGVFGSALAGRAVGSVGHAAGLDASYHATGWLLGSLSAFRSGLYLARSVEVIDCNLPVWMGLVLGYFMTGLPNPWTPTPKKHSSKTWASLNLVSAARYLGAVVESNRCFLALRSLLPSCCLHLNMQTSIYSIKICQSFGPSHKQQGHNKGQAVTTRLTCQQGHIPKELTEEQTNTIV